MKETQRRGVTKSVRAITGDCGTQHNSSAFLSRFLHHHNPSRRQQPVCPGNVFSVHCRLTEGFTFTV